MRREVEIALARRLKPGGPQVIPVLLGGAEPPSAETLPEGLRPLCELEAHRFIGKDADWQAQFERLLERLAGIPGVRKPRFRLPSGQAQPFRVIEHLLSPHFQDPQDRLGELRSALESAGTAAVVARAALYGMGGVGKTQLALKYSHAFRHASMPWLAARNAVSRCRRGPSRAPRSSAGSPDSRAGSWSTTTPRMWRRCAVFCRMAGATICSSPRGTPRGAAWPRPVSLDVWTAEQGAGSSARNHHTPA